MNHFPTEYFAGWPARIHEEKRSTIRRDILLHDSRIYATASMWTRPLVGAFRFGLAYQHVWRTSTMADITVKATEADILATTAFLF